MKLEVSDINIEVLPRESGLMIKQIIFGRLKLSRGLVRRMKNGGGVYLNGQLAYITQRVNAGDHLEIVFADEPTSVTPQPLDLDILYQDDYLLVINKAPDMAVYPTGTYPENTLVNGISHLWQQQGLKRKIRLLHRLDRETSGVIMVVKDPYTYQIMVNQLRNRQLKRNYLAVVQGFLPAKEGVIDEPIGRSSSIKGHALKRAVLDQGKPAQTYYRVVREYKELSLVQLALVTGRTHQIRVHLDWLGCPIIGDEVYFQPSDVIERQALHAWSIEFKHPLTAENLVVRAPLPQDMLTILRQQLN